MERLVTPMFEPARDARGVRLTRRRLLAFGFAAASMIGAAPLLAACGVAPPRPNQSGSAGAGTTTGPTPGGDLISSVSTRYIDVLDPNVTAQTVSHYIMAPMFDTLVLQSNDGQFHPSLATKWAVSGDGLVFTFTLQSGVKFHDGTPFNAAAVKANFDRMVAADTKSRLAGPRLSGFYAGSEAVDAQTVRVKFNQPNGSFLTDLSQNFMAMLSPAAVEKWGANEIGRHPTGTGPFKFVEWVENSHIKIERNDEYNWASPMHKRQGPAYLKTITFRIIPEESARLAAFEAGEINFIDQVPAIEFERLKSDPKYKTYSQPQPGIPYAFMINAKRPPTDELAVRQAINFAVDKTAIIQTLFRGLYTPAAGPLSPASLTYNAEVEKTYSFNQERAKQLLDGAGWQVGPDGIRVKAGKRLELNHYVFTDTRVAEVMQAQLKQVGIQSNVTLLEVGAVNEAATRGEVTNMAPLPYRDADPAVLCVALCTKNQGKGFAWTFHQDGELDKALELGQAAVEAAARKDHFGKAQVLAMNGALLIPVYNINGLAASTQAIQDVAYNVKGVDPWFYNVWIKSS